jgi:hypothetical protein
MGSIVSLDSQGPSSGKNLKDNGDWFVNQGYKLKLDIQCNRDALDDFEVYKNGRFSCILPTINPVTTQRNNDIYQHITSMKLTKLKNDKTLGDKTNRATISTQALSWH